MEKISQRFIQKRKLKVFSYSTSCRFKLAQFSFRFGAQKAGRILFFVNIMIAPFNINNMKSIYKMTKQYSL